MEFIKFITSDKYDIYVYNTSIIKGYKKGLDYIIIDDTNFSDFLSYEELLLIQKILRVNDIVWDNLDFRIKLIDCIRYAYKVGLDINEELKYTTDIYL